jgi:hypothetical protein
MTRKSYVKPFKRKKPGKKTKTVPVKGHDREIRGPAKKTRRVPPSESIFFPAKTAKYEKMVVLKSVDGARNSVDQLIDEFRKAKTRAKKRHVKKVTVLAANRAGVMARNRRLKQSTKNEKRRIMDIYRRAARKMVLPPK